MLRDLMMADMQRLLSSRIRKGVLVIAVIVAIVIAFGGARYSLSPVALIEQSGRVAAARVLSVVYRGDMEYVEEAMAKYYKGSATAVPEESADESWRRIERVVPGLRVIGGLEENRDSPPVPFVYESPDAAYLRVFRTTYRLKAIIEGAPDEYEAMLRLARWVGTRWDHGTDEVPGGNQVCDPSAVVRAGDAGSRFWCEIAARTMVHAATALGWQARAVTASRDGYTWEHAVAELWSNQFRKWFVVDTDFNVVFQRAGVPLSAFELVHEGERLQAAGQLEVVPFAAVKPSLPLTDLIPFFAYVHVDMRNDWCTRFLRRGSPAGGDYATWWTARPILNGLLTAKLRVDDQNQFNWKLDSVAIYAVSAEINKDNRLLVEVALKGYSPIFNDFELFVDDKLLSPIIESVYKVSVGIGVHAIKARFINNLSHPGVNPISEVKFKFSL